MLKLRDAFSDFKFNGIVVIQVQALKLFGLLPLEGKSFITKLVGFFNFGFFMGFMLGSMLLSEILNIIFQTGSVSELARSSFLTLTHMIQLPKSYNMMQQRDRLTKLLKDIDRREFLPKSPEQRKVLEFNIFMSKFVTCGGLGACLATCTFWCISPFIEDHAAVLPLAGWYPFDTTKSPGFEIALCYQTVASTCNAWSNASADILTAGLIAVVACQLEILNDSVRNIRQFAEMEMGDLGLGDEETISEELQERMNTQLMECVRHHRCILEFAEGISFLFSNSILGQFIVSVIIMCVTLFEIAEVPFGSVKFLALLLYMFCMLMEIFLWCYYGNEVTYQSLLLTNYAFHSDWRNCSIEFKKKLLFFMTRGQRPLKLKGGIFFTLSLELFVSTVRSSYSYFTLLLQVTKGKK